MLKLIGIIRKKTESWPWLGLFMAAVFLAGMMAIGSLPREPLTPSQNNFPSLHQQVRGGDNVMSNGTVGMLRGKIGQVIHSATSNRVTAVATVFSVGAALLLAWIAIIQIRTTRAQLRAYVDVEVANYEKHPDYPNAPWNISLKVRNFGQTPARNVRVHVESAIGEKRSESKAFPLSASMRTLPPIRIAPGHQIFVSIPPGIGPGFAGFEAASRSNLHSYIWGRIDYCDVFNRNWSLPFQMVCSFKGVLSFSFCAAGNND